MEQCCPNHFLGFCLENGTPIILVIEGNIQTGWININTGVFTLGAPPVGTVMCDGSTDRFLDCDTDSITICQPVVSATVTSVNASATVVTLLAANANRKGAIFYSDSTNLAYIKLGVAASVTSFSMRVQTQTAYEMTIGYTGIITGIWNGTNGAMRITEFM